MDSLTARRIKKKRRNQPKPRFCQQWASALPAPEEQPGQAGDTKSQGGQQDSAAEGLNHRTTEWFGLDGTLKLLHFQPPAQEVQVEQIWQHGSMESRSKALLLWAGNLQHPLHSKSNLIRLKVLIWAIYLIFLHADEIVSGTPGRISFTQRSVLVVLLIKKIKRGKYWCFVACSVSTLLINWRINYCCSDIRREGEEEISPNLEVKVLFLPLFIGEVLPPTFVPWGVC